MLDHKSRLKCIYWYAIYLVTCVRIDCTHGPGSPISLAVAPPARAAAGVGPALARHRCCRPDVGPTLDRPASLSGRCRVAGPGLCVNCSLHLNMQNIIISVKAIIIIIIIRDSPLSKHWLLCFKLSPALSALWTQLWWQKKEQPYTVCHSSRISYTRIPQRDWWVFLAVIPFHCCKIPVFMYLSTICTIIYDNICLDTSDHFSVLPS